MTWSKESFYGVEKVGTGEVTGEYSTCLLNAEFKLQNQKKILARAKFYFG